jgi:hypothetical protein
MPAPEIAQVLSVAKLMVPRLEPQLGVLSLQSATTFNTAVSVIRPFSAVTTMLVVPRANVFNWWQNYEKKTNKYP